MKRSAVKQDLGIYEVKPTRFQNGCALASDHSKSIQTRRYPRVWL